MTAIRKKDNSVRNILIVAVILFGLAFLAVGMMPFMRGFFDSVRNAPLFR